MKKLLLSLSVAATSFAAMSQVDTLTSHFNGNPTLYIPDAVMPADSGYVSGNNAYGDIAKMQLFDNTYGVTGAGTITNVCLAIPVKSGTGNIVVAIWGDNAGQPANPMTPLGTVTVNLTAIDTAIAAFSVVDGTRFYNHVATFASPIAIPANQKFWAGVVLPTGAGNTVALFSSNMQTNAFADAVTHTGEFWGDGTFHTFGDAQNWNADIALGIYPVVNLTLGLNENSVESTVYPNPATSELTIKTSEEIASVVITTTDGKVVATAESGNVNLAELNAGMYIYQVTTVSGKIGTGNFVKK